MFGALTDFTVDLFACALGYAVGDWMDQDEGQDRLARRAVGISGRFADPVGLVEDARRAVGRLADLLAEQGFPSLAAVVGEGDPPLLAAAFGYFLRRELADNE